VYIIIAGGWTIPLTFSGLVPPKGIGASALAWCPLYLFYPITKAETYPVMAYKMILDTKND
jgi:hypothetical protein